MIKLIRRHKVTQTTFRFIDYNHVELHAEIQLNAQKFQFSLRPVYLPGFPVLVESRNLDSEIMNVHEYVLYCLFAGTGGHKAGY